MDPRVKCNKTFLLLFSKIVHEVDLTFIQVNEAILILFMDVTALKDVRKFSGINYAARYARKYLEVINIFKYA